MTTKPGDMQRIVLRIDRALAFITVTNYHGTMKISAMVCVYMAALLWPIAAIAAAGAMVEANVDDSGTLIVSLRNDSDQAFRISDVSIEAPGHPRCFAIFSPTVVQSGAHIEWRQERCIQNHLEGERVRLQALNLPATGGSLVTFTPVTETEQAKLASLPQLPPEVLGAPITSYVALTLTLDQAGAVYRSTLLWILRLENKVTPGQEIGHPGLVPAELVLARQLEEVRAAYGRKDYATALRLVQPLADRGVAKAEFCLGAMYALGQATHRDIAASSQWFRRAADHGLPGAEQAFARFSDTSVEEPDDLKEWLRRLADQGNTRAQIWLGDIAWGSGNETAAKEWYLRAASQSDANGWMALGTHYYYKRVIVEGGHLKHLDAGEAAQWVRKAADQGLPAAQWFLAMLYDTGEGVPQDAALSLQWLRKAAGQGMTVAQAWLGDLYFKGTAVLPQNYNLAMEWRRKAADQGNSSSDKTVGQMYASGQGVPQDDQQAQYWFRKSDEDLKKIYSLACAAIPPGCSASELSLVPLCSELVRIKAVLEMTGTPPR